MWTAAADPFVAGAAVRRYPVLDYPERFEPVKDLLFIALFVGAWLALQMWVLPRLGIPT